MSRHSKDKEKKNTEKKWESYGAAFWMVMAASSALMAVLGLAVFGISAFRVLFGGVWYFWGALAITGAGAFALSVFCLDLFPSWASVVRTIRLSDARMAGAMSIAQINKYEEREDRRTTDVKDTVQESYTKVGKDVISTQQKVDALDQKFSQYMTASADTSSIFRELRNEIAAINRKIESSIESTNRTVRTLKEELDGIERYKKDNAGYSADVSDVNDGRDNEPPSLSSDEEIKNENGETGNSGRKTEKRKKEKEETSDNGSTGENGGKKTQKRKKKKASEPAEVDSDGFNLTDDLKDAMADYADTLTSFGIGAGWSEELISDSDSDPYAGRSQEKDAAGDAEKTAESVGDGKEDTEETVEEPAEDAEESDGGMNSYWD